MVRFLSCMGFGYDEWRDDRYFFSTFSAIATSFGSAHDENAPTIGSPSHRPEKTERRIMSSRRNPFFLLTRTLHEGAFPSYWSNLTEKTSDSLSSKRSLFAIASQRSCASVLIASYLAFAICFGVWNLKATSPCLVFECAVTRDDERFKKQCQT